MQILRNWHGRNNVSVTLDRCRILNSIWYWTEFMFETTVEANVDEVHADWLKSEGQAHIKTVATHYGIYEHLFGCAYFVPRIPLDIKVWRQKLSQMQYKESDIVHIFHFQFEVDEDTLAPVYFGNTLKPKHAKEAPIVSFDSSIKLLSKNQVNICRSSTYSMANTQLMKNYNFRRKKIHCGRWCWQTLTVIWRTRKRNMCIGSCKLNFESHI